jgi:hypothetical protein
MQRVRIDHLRVDGLVELLARPALPLHQLREWSLADLHVGWCRHSRHAHRRQAGTRGQHRPHATIGGPVMTPFYKEVPYTVARCPDCERWLMLEVNEWEAGTGIPTECGCHVFCERIHINTEASEHPSLYWPAIDAAVYAWACEHVRVRWTKDGAELVTPAEYEQDKLAAWQAWALGAHGRAGFEE